MRRATVLVAILLSHTFTICVRAGGYDERGLTDRTLDQIGGPSGVKRGAVEESGRLDPATLRSRWEAAARGDAPESKPAAPVIPEEERLAKPSDEIGRAPAGNETNRTDTTEESVTGGEDPSPRGEGEASPTESIEDLEAEWDDLRPCRCGRLSVFLFVCRSCSCCCVAPPGQRNQLEVLNLPVRV